MSTGVVGSQQRESPSSNMASEEPDEGPAGRLLRLLLVGTVAAVALKLLPSIGTAFLWKSFIRFFPPDECT